MAYFDRIFVINLDRRTDRWREAESELRLCGILAERFAAIEAAPGESPVVGCMASHRALWRSIASGECGARVLILEDDFMLTTRAELVRVGYQEGGDVLDIFDSCPGTTFADRFTAMMPCIPTVWDLLYLGGSYEAPPRRRENRHVIRNAGMHTTHAYAVSRAYAEILAARKYEGGGCDSLLAELAKDDAVFSYTLTPRLFMQRPTSISDINPKALGYPWSMIDHVHERMV